MQRFTVAFEDGVADELRVEAARRRVSVAELIRVRTLDGGEPGVETRSAAVATAAVPGLGSDAAQASSSPPSSVSEMMGVAGGAGSPSPEPAAGSSVKPDPKPGAKR